MSARTWTGRGCWPSTSVMGVASLPPSEKLLTNTMLRFRLEFCHGQLASNQSDKNRYTANGTLGARSSTVSFLHDSLITSYCSYGDCRCSLCNKHRVMMPTLHPLSHLTSRIRCRLHPLLVSHWTLATTSCSCTATVTTAWS